MNFKQRRAARIAELQARGPKVDKRPKLSREANKARKERLGKQLLANLKEGKKISAGFYSPNEFQTAVKFWHDLGWLVADPISGPKCKLHETVYCKHRACVWTW